MKSIKKLFLKYRFILLTISGVVLFILGIINLYYITSIRVTSNDECLWLNKKVTADSSTIVFDKVKVNGVTWNAGIRDGDELLRINEKNLVNTNHAQMLLNMVPEGEFAKYTIKKGEEISEVEVYVKKLINFPWLAMGLISIIWLIIGFVVIMAKPDGLTQRIFYLIGVTFVISMLFVLISGLDASPLWMMYVIDHLFTFGMFFLPFLVIYFFWIYPKPFAFAEKKWVKRLVFGIPAVAFVGFQILKFAYLYNNAEANQFAYQFVYGFTNNFMMYSFLIGYISLIINFFRIKKKEEKKPLLVIIAAYTLTISSFIYFIFIATAIAETIFNNPEYFMPILLVIILPISFGYSIFKYQLMDVSVVIKNTITYGAATISLAALYFLVIYLIGQGVSQAIGTENQGIIAGIVFIIFAMIFQSTKDKFQDFLTAKFYPEQFAYQKVLMQFSTEVPTLVGLENILDAMKSTFVEALMLKEFGIMLISGSEGGFKLVRCTGIVNRDLLITQNRVRSVIKQKIEVSKKPVIEREDFTAAFPDEIVAELEKEGIYTIIPMLIKQKVVGLLLFGLKHSGAKFAGKDLDLLFAASSQSAISIENARLYETEAEKLRMERDLDLARKIQQSLLPKEIPLINGLEISGAMIPAQQVGGDYYDIIPVTDNKIFIVVGDVSGKGLSAALYMTKLQTMVQLACNQHRGPKEILIDINKGLYATIERNSFVTMTLALFDMEKMKVRFCRAGHMPVFAAKNGSVSSYKTQGIGVGLEKGIIFENTLIEEEVDLMPGQMYAFFSDGITEAMNEQSELFGEESFKTLLSGRQGAGVKEILDQIWLSVDNFRGKAVPNDDMTLVLVKVKESLAEKF
jgi:phosphoserine phosphatase RsbU/P